jgi:hypothetical protein
MIHIMLASPSGQLGVPKFVGSPSYNASSATREFLPCLWRALAYREDAGSRRGYAELSPGLEAQATFLGIRSPGPLLLLGMRDFSEILSAFRQE